MLFPPSQSVYSTFYREVSLALHQKIDILPDSERSHAVMQVNLSLSNFQALGLPQ